ncbi:ribosomal protein S18 acetylase RimI-like enzyme [Paenibacillus taihuensis]|uniref:Ribosomal protein S18 acetylase RimI-like enzyme n=1 Tax=Paenibacillus taihuensis TaxID=1156355 RepID=A0A3D9S9S7_9BACL|nr:GNAT family N-acetyltransferase [Paenibacillus taihuensis]REE85192.1 ribosomal protein S18 acetylase RimI-like enzyme [Paenibacillus taihuensis]
MIRARRARIDDDEIIRLIKCELIPLSYTASPRDAQTIRELPRRLSDGVTLVSSRTKSSLPQGFLHFYTQGERLLLDMLVVHPQHRNKQIGTKLLCKAEEHARLAGCRYATLFVDFSNPRAQRLYQRLGFQTIRSYPELRCYEMAKRLDQ